METESQLPIEFEMSGEELTFLKHVSASVNHPIPFSVFYVTNASHTVAVEYAPKAFHCRALFPLMVIPKSFIRKNNHIIIRPSLFRDASLDVNQLQIGCEEPEGYNRVKNERLSLKLIDEDGKRVVRFTMSGSLLKDFLSMKGVEYIELIRNQNFTGMFSYCKPVLKAEDVYATYVHSGESSDEEIHSYLDAGYLRDFKTVIPNGDINITFSHNHPIVMDWETKEESKIRLVIAPRLVDYE